MWIKTSGNHFGSVVNCYGLLNIDTGNIIQIRSYNCDTADAFWDVAFFPNFKLPASADITTHKHSPKDRGWYADPTYKKIIVDDEFASDFNVVSIACFDTFEEAKKYLDKLAEKLGVEVIDIEKD